MELDDFMNECPRSSSMFLGKKKGDIMTQNEQLNRETAKALMGYYSWHMDELLEPVKSAFISLACHEELIKASERGGFTSFMDTEAEYRDEE